MSYDLFVQDLPPDLDTVDDIPDDFEPRSLGARGALISQILAILPDADFSDPSCGVVKGEGYTIEIGLGDADTVPSFVLHLRGGDGALPAAHHLLDTLGLDALDPQAESGLFAFDDEAVANFKAWRKFQDTVGG
jgi:hypothetical protein